MVNIWLVPLALLFEIVGLQGLIASNINKAYLLIEPIGNENSLFQYIVGHCIASIIMSVVLLKLLPNRYRNPWRNSFVFLFTLQFFLPVIGTIGVSLGILLAMLLPHGKREQLWSEISIPDLPFKPQEIDLQPLYSQGGLRQIIKAAGSSDKRLKAVMATKQMNKRDAIVILQNALMDKVDDIRLLAYSMLDSMEKNISEKINSDLESLKTATKTQAFTLKKSLSENYWEMSYLGLAKGGVRLHFLNRSKQLLDELISENIEKNGDILKIKGRIHLALEEYQPAIDAFKQSLETGMPKTQVIPYLAEAVFYSGDYQQLRLLLAEYTKHMTTIDAFTPVLNYWQSPITEFQTPTPQQSLIGSTR